jgi:anti-anti-sigma factor
MLEHNLQGRHGGNLAELGRRNMSQLKSISDGAVRTVFFTTARILDEATIRSIGEELFAILDKSEERNVLLDFRAVQFMSSSTLGLLIRFAKRCKEFNAKLKLCGISAQILQVFKITGLDKVFDIQKDQQTAIAAFGV